MMDERILLVDDGAYSELALDQDTVERLDPESLRDLLESPASTGSPLLPSISNISLVIVTSTDWIDDALRLGPPVIASLMRFELPSSLEGLAGVVVPHRRLGDELERRGMPRSRIVELPFWPPKGFVRDPDAAARRKGLGLASRVVVVSGRLVEEVGASLLIQLALVADTSFLVDVAMDPELARALRRSLPAYELDAWLFAGGDDAATYWQLADIVLAAPESDELARALGVGAGLCLLGSARGVNELVEAARLARCATVTTLAVDLETLLLPEGLKASRLEVEALTGGSAEGFWGAVGELVEAVRTEPAAGLPDGLERILPFSGEIVESTPRPDIAPKSPPGPSDLDDRINDELAALKRSLGV